MKEGREDMNQAFTEKLKRQELTSFLFDDIMGWG
jgi:hypothetical protein